MPTTPISSGPPAPPRPACIHTRPQRCLSNRHLPTTRTACIPSQPADQTLFVENVATPRQQHRPLPLAELAQADGALVDAHADAAELLLDLALLGDAARVAFDQRHRERRELRGRGSGGSGGTEKLADGRERFVVRGLRLERCYEQVEIGQAEGRRSSGRRRCRARC